MPHSLDNLRVILVTPRNSLNIGAAARALSNFGALHLRLVNPFEPSFREAVSAVGASHILQSAEVCSSVPEAIADCSLVVGTTAVGNRELLHPLHTLQHAGPLLHQSLSHSRTALLFGSEKWGLSNDALSHCHWLLRIPTREEHRSMNLGQAVAICMYELSRSSTENLAPSPETAATSSATMETVDRISSTLLEALHKSGYVAPRGESTAEEKLRRMLLRFRLESSDAEVFLGMLKKILWKLNDPQ